MDDPIRGALVLLQQLDPGDITEDVHRARALLAKGVEKLPLVCSICGRYGCTHDHGY